MLKTIIFSFTHYDLYTVKDKFHVLSNTRHLQMLLIGQTGVEFCHLA